jgi:hypothetical protein
VAALFKPNAFAGLLLGILAKTHCLANPLLLKNILFGKLDAEGVKLTAITILNIIMIVVKTAARTLSLLGM